jgi:hypothetical protein
LLESFRDRRGFAASPRSSTAERKKANEDGGLYAVAALVPDGPHLELIFLDAKGCLRLRERDVIISLPQLAIPPIAAVRRVFRLNVEVNASFDDGAALSEDAYLLRSNIRAAQLAPELVLRDIRRVGARDGIDGAAEIKDRFNIPIIFVTANIGSRSHHRCIEGRGSGLRPRLSEFGNPCSSCAKV